MHCPHNRIQQHEEDKDGNGFLGPSKGLKQELTPTRKMKRDIQKEEVASAAFSLSLDYGRGVA